MRAAPRQVHLQRPPTVRLRRETWGGVALDRDSGDRLELDHVGFAVLVALGSVHTVRSLGEELRAQGHDVRLPELAGLAKTLQRAGFVAETGPDLNPLPSDPWTAAYAPDVSDGLRAPLVAHWAVTYRCNLQCPACYCQGGPRRPDALGFRQRLAMIRRLGQWGVLEVALGGGEPTVLPELPRLLAALRAEAIVPNVTTNGLITRRAMIQALAQHAGIVHLSADRPELLDAVRGPGAFRQVAEAICRLRDAGARLGVNLLLTPENVQDIRRSLDALTGLGIRQITMLRPKGPWCAAHWPGFPRLKDLRPLASDLGAYLAEQPPLRLYVDTALRGMWAQLGLLEDPEPEVAGCGGGQTHVGVTPEGDVYPCSHVCRPRYRMGNLLTDAPDQLWLSGAGLAARRRYRADCQGVQCPCCTPARRSECRGTDKSDAWVSSLDPLYRSLR